jgi:3-dehydroquinate synthase
MGEVKRGTNMEYTVQLGPRSYPIIIQHSIVNKLPQLLKKQFSKSRFAIVTNTTMVSLYKDKITEWEQALGAKTCVIPDGEKHKTIDTWNSIQNFLIENKFERSSVLIALGGGVTGDITGFAAATFLRGIAFVQIPTTLLSMVDSSVGGKTGVDHPLGKNLIGAFHQPAAVFVDTSFFATLPDREFISGYAEVFKCAFIGSRSMFDFIKKNNKAILAKEQEPVLEGIRRSIEIKAHIVEQDEFETKGLRALLNFGHTFAHSFERYFNFGDILHGEAVFWGIKCACELGRKIDTVTPDDYVLYNDLLKEMPLPPMPSKPDPEVIYNNMFSDKKVATGKINFVVPTVPGISIVKGSVTKDDVIYVLNKVFCQ